VTQIRRAGERGARVVYRNGRGGAETAIEAPFVLVTVPLSVLKDVPADFSPRYRTAIAAGDYIPAAKVAFFARRRFWELDEQIYGGMSWTTQDITQMWYPSSGYQGATGILIGGYIWTTDIGDRFAAMAPAGVLMALQSTVDEEHRDLLMVSVLMGASGFLPLSPQLADAASLSPGDLAEVERLWKQHGGPWHGSQIAPSSWNVTRVRPANHPVRRIAAAALLVARMPGGIVFDTTERDGAPE